MSVSSIKFQLEIDEDGNIYVPGYAVTLRDKPDPVTQLGDESTWVEYHHSTLGLNVFYEEVKKWVLNDQQIVMVQPIKVMI